MSLQLKSSFTKFDDKLDELCIFVLVEADNDSCQSYFKVSLKDRPYDEDILFIAQDMIQSIKYQLFKYYKNQNFHFNDFTGFQRVIYDTIMKERSEYHQKKVQSYTQKYKEELISKSWHPDRLDWVLDNEEKQNVSKSFN